MTARCPPRPRTPRDESQRVRGKSPRVTGLKMCGERALVAVSSEQEVGSSDQLRETEKAAKGADGEHPTDEAPPRSAVCAAHRPAGAANDRRDTDEWNEEPAVQSDAGRRESAGKDQLTPERTPPEHTR